MKTEDSNKLIAIFMENHNDPNFDGRVCYGDYHNSWDWLMPVAFKCEKESIKSWNDRSSTRPKSVPPEIMEVFVRSEGECEKTIHEVYKAVVGFIEWYNQNKKT